LQHFLQQRKISRAARKDLADRMLCKPGLSHNWSINCQSFSSSRSLLTDINSSFLRIVSMKYMHQLRILTAVVQRNECFRINKNSLGQLIVSCTSKQALSPYLLPMESFLQKWRNFYKQCEINSILKLSRNSDLKKNWTYVLLPSICLANNATQKRLLRLFSPTMSKRTPYYIVYIYISNVTNCITYPYTSLSQTQDICAKNVRTHD